MMVSDRYCGARPYMHLNIRTQTLKTIPGLMPTVDSELTMSLYGTKPGTEDPSPPCREGVGIR